MALAAPSRPFGALFDTFTSWVWLFVNYNRVELIFLNHGPDLDQIAGAFALCIPCPL